MRYLLYFRIILLLLNLFKIDTLLYAENKKCQKNIKVVVILPLSSGPTSSGEAVKKSILLADDKYDKKECVDFHFEDDQFQPKNTLTLVNKHIAEKRVDAFIIWGTPTSLSASIVTERHKIPLIALSMFDKVVENKRYVVKHWSRAEDINLKITEEVQRRGYKTVAIFSVQNEATLKLRDLFREKTSAEIILDEEFTRDVTDFRSSISRIDKKRTDAIYVLLFPPQVAPFAKQLKELGFHKDIFGATNLQDLNEVKASEFSLVGAWLVNANDAKGEEYSKDYFEKYGERTIVGGGSGFDTAKMLIEVTYQEEKDLNTYIHNLKNFSGSSLFQEVCK